MDILPLAGMLFSLLVVLIIAGTILMFPVMRRLGRLLEARLDEPRRDPLAPGDAAELRQLVGELRDEVAQLAERQRFTERLLDQPSSPAEGGGAG